MVNEIEETNLLEGDLPIAVAFDTNMYFNLFFDQLTQLLLKKYNKPPFPINFICSNGVKTELTGYEWKYKNNDIEDIKRVCYRPNIIDNFFNQNKLTSREWHLGHIDYLESIEFTYSKIVDIEDEITNDDMDSKIIEGIVKEISQQDLKLFLYSQDSDFISRAKGNRNIVPIYLEKVPYYKLGHHLFSEWESFLRLLYILSVTFGAIELTFDEKSFIIYGIWKGKKYGHWEQKCIKIVSTDKIIQNIR
ncbi:MAG: hypothetical protein P8Y97_22055, partial [Candidatus Lokiarchaeota archaeon]